MKVLHVDASILGASSVSRQLSAAVVARIRQADPDMAAAQGGFAASTSLQQDVARGRPALMDFLGADRRKASIAAATAEAASLAA